MNHPEEKKKIVIIGAGAAGLMAAAAASGSGGRVIVLEKNEKAGKKIYITGKGRCNLTNTCDPSDFFDHVVRNPKFLYSSVYGFDAGAVMAFMEGNGCPVKTERGGRVFPVSDHASDVTRALLNCIRKNGAEIRYNTQVKDILIRESKETASVQGTGSRNTGQDAGKGDSGAAGNISAVYGVRLADGSLIRADAVILCTGGRSYPSTGSTGDGYRMAGNLGIAVKKPAPSLVPLCTKEEWCKALQGLSLKNVQLTLMKTPEADSMPCDRERKESGHDPAEGPAQNPAQNAGQDPARKSKRSGKRRKNTVLYTGFGEMLFTHFGISGPLVLTASCYTDFDAERSYLALLDLKPYMTAEELEARIRREFDSKRDKQLGNVLRALLPAKLAKVIAQLSDPGENRVVSAINEKEIRELAALLKAVPIHVTGSRGFAEAIVTKGGLDVRSFDPSTMECRQIRGLFAAGEVLDVDAHTGGFNLQIAWSTGHLAGESAAIS